MAGSITGDRERLHVTSRRTRSDRCLCHVIAPIVAGLGALGLVALILRIVG